jgi:hypothetical protein
VVPDTASYGLKEKLAPPEDLSYLPSKSLLARQAKRTRTLDPAAGRHSGLFRGASR